MEKKITNIFLTSIEQDKKELFKNKFILGIHEKTILTKILPKSNIKSIHAWGFVPSEKNLKIWQNLNIDDWVLFYFDGRYSYASKIIQKEKSEQLTAKILGKINQNRNLVILFSKIFKIKKGFQKTNLEMGLETTIPEIHKINMIQAKEISVKKIIEKFGSIESYLEIIAPKITHKDISDIIPSSMKKEPKRIKSITLRRIRDTKKSIDLKKVYNNKCQICNYSFPDYVESGYSEVHHVWPMADNGDDDFDNMLVLCPNHHTEFDYGVIQFSQNTQKIEDIKGKIIGTVSFKKGHKLNKKNIEFHNERVRKIFES